MQGGKNTETTGRTITIGFGDTASIQAPLDQLLKQIAHEVEVPEDDGIEIDPAELRTLMTAAGATRIGVGAGTGEARALDAVKQGIEAAGGDLLQDASHIWVRLQGDIDLSAISAVNSYFDGWDEDISIIITSKRLETPGSCKAIIVAGGIG